MKSDAGLLAPLGLSPSILHRNASVARLYEFALLSDRGVLSSSGALATRSGAKTGRSPNDKRIVESPESIDDVWWGAVNVPIAPQSFQQLKQAALHHLNANGTLYVCDGFAGWDPRYRLKIRVICTRPYHALFMHNMLIRPTVAELAEFGDPDMVIYNVGTYQANPKIPGVSSGTSISLNLETKEMLIFGTEYAGEMKKGVFSAMNYFMPRAQILSMHCSATSSRNGSVSLFFGLSGTGKTTLSADPRRQLIGDDEHCWSADGIFNIEGGCYAKCIGLRQEKEPQIFQAIRFGTVLENTVQDQETRLIQFDDDSITENTRAAYPIEFIDNARIPCVGGHPTDVIFLTCDAFGVLPPVSRLTPEQAMYHFISGYTAKVAGTEDGVKEPKATFSPCYGGAFLVWHPAKYAELLQEKMRRHNVNAWLINTGWTGGAYGVGNRIPLAATRAIVDAIHDGVLASAPANLDPVFGLNYITSCRGCDSLIMRARDAWSDPIAYDRAALELADRFQRNFKEYENHVGESVLSAGPSKTTVCL
jgi:phosphoenolpyruvate carboxykinase (ATP)